MATKIILLFLFIVSIAALVVLYAYKLALHFQFLRLRDKRQVGELSDFFYRHFINKKDAERWKQAWMLYPLMFPVIMEEDDKQEVVQMKQRIKRMNVKIYMVLIVAMLVVVYAAKAFPEGLF